jgi:hypothetical protein
VSTGSKTLSGENRWFQPPDAENRMSGGVGEVTGAIPSPRPVQLLKLFHARSLALNALTFQKMSFSMMFFSMSSMVFLIVTLVPLWKKVALKLIISH